jgi:hypothetical protein
MRVRPKRSVITRRPRAHAPGGSARAHPLPRAAAARPAAPAVEHPHEKRARESGGPIDRASYTCGCGMVFEADVSTTVACPHCGCGQAW